MKGAHFVLGMVLHALILAGAIVYVGSTARLPVTAAPMDGAPMPGRRQAEGPPTNTPADRIRVGKTVSARAAEDYVYGEASAPLTLFLYIDQECPYCEVVYPTTKALVDQSGGQIKLAVRHFPLEMHPGARPLARAAECVARQKGATGFFAFLDSVFGKRIRAGAEVPPGMGLDDASYRDCFASPDIDVEIARDADEATAIGVSGTPALVMYNSGNGQAILRLGALDLAQIRESFRQVQ